MKSFDKIFSYSPDDLDETFKREAADVLACARGAGYWVWKPYVILKTLERMKDGEKLFYCDAGAYFVRPMRALVDAFKNAKNGVMFFGISHSNHINRQWTKRDVFVLLNCDTPEYTDRMQLLAGYCLIEKSDFAVSFMREWLHLCMQKQLVSDDPNIAGKENYPDFQSHFHDQSLLNIVATKYKLDTFRLPSEYGLPYVDHYKNSPYPQIIRALRKGTVRLQDEFNAYADIRAQNPDSRRLSTLLSFLMVGCFIGERIRRISVLLQRITVAMLVLITPRPLKTWRKNFLARKKSSKKKDKTKN